MTLTQWKLAKFYFNKPVQINGITWYVKGIEYITGAIRVARGTDFYQKTKIVSYKVVDAPIVHPEPPALDLIAAEREKQISKGYTVEHDAEYTERTGISYSLLADRLLFNGDLPDDWNIDYWIKLRNLPNKDKLRIAGAWIAAELDRVIHLQNKKQ